MSPNTQQNKTFFSIIVAALNPEEKWKATLKSVLNQDYPHFEIVYKDAGSRDDSFLQVRKLAAKEPRLKTFQEKDHGIYDGMNQALLHVTGDYVLFLNCGDTLYNTEVLLRTASFIQKEGLSARDGKPCILYGDTFCEQTASLDKSPSEITGFTCYRNIPCHQSCFYDTRLFRTRSYDLTYRIRADYEHFLWCYYRAGAGMLYLNKPVASYEGGGYSESKENRDRDRREHQMITRQYMKTGKLLCYRLAMWLTLAPLRRWLAQSKWFAKMYRKAKIMIYGRRK